MESFNYSRNAERFLADIKNLYKKTCWSIIAGEGTGSNVSINFGEKILLKRPLKNPHLSEEERKYDGEYGLYITCSWRMDSDMHVVCGSKEPNRNNGAMVKGLKNLLNARVADIIVSKPAFDLVLNFDNKYSLKIS